MTSPKPTTHRVIGILSRVIFETRWLLVPIYLAMIIAIAAYVVLFTKQAIDMGLGVWHWDAEHLLLASLALVDMSMIANLIVMILAGGFSTFVAEFDQSLFPNRPRWMNGLDSTTLKIQMGKSLIGVTSVHLLQTFMRLHDILKEENGKFLVAIEIIIHMVFIITTVAYCYISKLTHGHKVSPAVLPTPASAEGH